MQAIPEKILKLIANLVFFTAFTIAGCKKNTEKEDCPLQTYHLECDVKSWDFEFGGYDTGTDAFTVEANCPRDAEKIAADMSYTFGQSYKRCRVVP